MERQEQKEAFSRTELLLKEEGLMRLADARVAVFGLGGVGSYVIEALARAGVGALDLIDYDTIDLSNLNRQILATVSSLGQRKVDVAKERISDINPFCNVRTYPVFFLPDTNTQFDFSQYDYVVDAIDTVTGKVLLAVKAQEAGCPIISCMGTGNKLNPAAFCVADIYETQVCPLARVMRRELKKRNIKKLKVVYSREQPISMRDSSETGCEAVERGETARRAVPGSVSFVPGAAGLIMAGEVIRDLAVRDLPGR